MILVFFLAFSSLIMPSLTPVVNAGTWSSKSPMPTARTDLAAVGYNGKIYTFGGYASLGRLSKVEVYDPSSNSWTTKNPIPQAIDNVGAAVIGNKIYVMGHDGSSIRFYEYNPADDSWTSKPTPPVSTFDQAGYGALNNILYVAYGSWPTGSWTYAYDPSSNTWSSKKPISDIAERSIESFVVMGNKLYAIGGNEPKAGATEISRIDVYDPATDSWQKGAIPDMPGQRTHLSPTTPVINGKAYVIGGWDGWSEQSTVFVYDPATNSWSSEANMPTARFELACTSIGGNIYALGGDSGGAGGNYKSANEVLNVGVFWYSSEYVSDSYKIASFEIVEDWIWKNCVPLLVLNSKSYGYWFFKATKDADTVMQEAGHRPDWYYRVVVDENNKRFSVQFFAHWNEQFAWYFIDTEKCALLSGHKWDYEPIFLYYTYTDNDFFSSLLMGTVNYEYVFHPIGHSLVVPLKSLLGKGTDVGESSNKKLFFWTDINGKKHPVFTIGESFEGGGGTSASLISSGLPTSWAGHEYGYVRKSGRVGIDIVPTITGDQFISDIMKSGYEAFYPNEILFDNAFKTDHFKRLTDDIITLWKQRSENPFKMLPPQSQDLVNPWNDLFEGQYWSIGRTFDPIETIPPELLVYIQSPIDLHTYDPIGRHTGLTATGKLETDIPESYYHPFNPHMILILEPILGNYRVVLIGRENGAYNLSIVLSNTIGAEVFTVSYFGNITEGTELESTISLFKTPEGDLNAFSTPLRPRQAVGGVIISLRKYELYLTILQPYLLTLIFVTFLVTVTIIINKKLNKFTKNQCQ